MFAQYWLENQNTFPRKRSPLTRSILPPLADYFESQCACLRHAESTAFKTGVFGFTDKCGKFGENLRKGIAEKGNFKVCRNFSPLSILSCIVAPAILRWLLSAGGEEPRRSTWAGGQARVLGERGPSRADAAPCRPPPSISAAFSYCSMLVCSRRPSQSDT